jgi:hypothetical protein
MAEMPETVKFCTYVLRLKSEVVFGSQKHKPDMPMEMNRNHIGLIKSLL